MGRKENLYSKEFIDYYIKLGINHIFIYDHNKPNTEKIIDTVENYYKDKVSVYNASLKNITNQSIAFTDCYQNNKHKYDWFFMLDMDEYLFIEKNNLKDYLSTSIFDKCDIIVFHWVLATDNNLLHYDNRSLFERFKGPYKKSIFVKSIIRGNISNLVYGIHGPNYSPEKNITCDNEGKIMSYKKIRYNSFTPINIKNGYIIHFRYKSTEEFINKYKRGYDVWHGNQTKRILYSRIKEYFQLNLITSEKVKLIEKELKLNLNEYRRFCKYEKKNQSTKSV